MSEGYVYILLNPSLRLHRYKIGMTTRSPAERAIEISGTTGVPEPFEVAYSRKITDCRKAEQLIHDRLNEKRVSSNREFYDVELQDAVRLLDSVANEVGFLPDDEVSSGAVPGEKLEFTAEDEAVQEVSEVPEFEIHVPPKKSPRSSSGKKGGRKTIEDHLLVCDQGITDLFEVFREGVKAIDSAIQENSWSYGVAYRANQNFIEMYFRSNRLEVCLRPTVYSDPEKLLGKVPDSYKWTLNRRFLLEDETQLDYLIMLVKQSYANVA